MTTSVVDPDGRGITRIQFVWLDPAGRRHVRMPSETAPGVYVTTLGPFFIVGDITYFAVVTDSEGHNVESEPGWLTVRPCPPPITVLGTTTTTTTVPRTTTTNP